MLGILSTLIVGLVLADGDKFPGLTQMVGGNCGLTTVYDIQFVDIIPWPPSPGGISEITMQGQFLQSTFVQELVLGTMYNGQIWNYQPVDINQSFQAGVVEDFLMLAVFPNEQGFYTSTIQLTAGDHICCWQFQYNIS